jgi:hypothetical protein
MRHEATEGRSVAAPVQGCRAAGHGGAQRGCARTGGQGSRARRGAARLRPYRGAVGRGNEAWFTKGVVNVPSANTTRGRDS